MKVVHLLTLLALVLFAVACGENGNNAKADIDSKEGALSYALGVNIGESISRLELNEDELNAEKITEGFMAGFEADSLGAAEVNDKIMARMGSQTPSATKEEGEQIAFYFGKSIIANYASVIDMPKTDFNENSFKMGLQAGMGKDSILIEKPVRDSLLQTYMEPKQQEANAVMRAKQEAAAQVNAAKGEAFLAENKTKEGVMTTESGLQYEIIEPGTGAQPTSTDIVKVHYTGTLMDGSVFDSSVERGTPAEFGVGQVIPGWQEGIPLMKEGAKYRFYIPNNLAYGPSSPTPKIPAGSMLIFDVELIQVNPEAATE